MGSESNGTKLSRFRSGGFYQKVKGSDLDLYGFTSNERL